MSPMNRPNGVFDVKESETGIGFVFSSVMPHIDEVCERVGQYLRSVVPGIGKHLFAIHLVIREGLTNAVRHGNGGDPEKLVRFELLIDDGKKVRMRIEDQGEGFDWRGYRTDHLSDGEDHGRGIIIMNTYFNKYAYNEKGNVLYLEKKLSS